MKMKSTLLFSFAVFFLSAVVATGNKADILDYMESLYPAYKEIKDTILSQSELTNSGRLMELKLFPLMFACVTLYNDTTLAG